MKGKSNIFKKNVKMVDNYKNSIRRYTPEDVGTVNDISENLKSSSQITDSWDGSNNDRNDIPISSPSINIKIRKWLIDNWIGLALGVILLWMGVEVINLKVAIGKVETKVEFISTSILKMDTDYVTKLELNLELEKIKNSLDKNNINDIIKKLDELETKIERSK